MDLGWITYKIGTIFDGRVLRSLTGRGAKQLYRRLVRHPNTGYFVSPLSPLPIRRQCWNQQHMKVPHHKFNHLLLIVAVTLYSKFTYFYYYYHYQCKITFKHVWENIGYCCWETIALHPVCKWDTTGYFWGDLGTISRHDRGNKIQRFLTESRAILFVATEPAVVSIIMFWLKISDKKPGDVLRSPQDISRFLIRYLELDLGWITYKIDTIFDGRVLRSLTGRGVKLLFRWLVRHPNTDYFVSPLSPLPICRQCWNQQHMKVPCHRSDQDINYLEPKHDDDNHNVVKIEPKKM